MLRKLQTVLPRHSLLTIYKAFIRPHLDYFDAIYDKIFNESCHKKLESAQYNSSLAIIGAIRGTNTLKFYQELGLESLQNRRKLRRLSLFYKIYNGQSPLQNVKKILTIKVKNNFFENSFFPATITECNDLDYSLTQCSFHQCFQAKYFEVYSPRS